ncbi:hypothetical protein WJX72_007483 [[Myrmecia] bisecta]|uniref:Tetratricopeptide repeat protein n=1 Tax=[Myrmecia] bisecta TaxID=41462 RepID=A0AAW1PQE6_9CHLO
MLCLSTTSTGPLPKNPDMQAGVRSATQGNFADAEKYFETVLKSDSQSASAWSNIANVHLSTGRAELALEEFTRAVELAPQAPVPLLNRALAEEQLGANAAELGQSADALQHYRQAIQDCQAAIQRDPKEFAAWFNKGNVEMRLEDFDAAMKSYHQAAELAPGIAGYRLREAELLFQQNETAKAETLMRTVVRKYPYYAEAHAALAAVEWSGGDLAKAEGQFNTATASESRFRDMDFVRRSTRWPPKLYEAMQRFLSIT